MSEKYKMYCIFSKESLSRMNGIRGKMASQAGHAFLHTFLKSMEKYKEDCEEYVKDKSYKITLIVETDEDLINLNKAYENICGTQLIIDAGLTVFKEPTLTCLGIGPIRETKINDDIKKLKLLT